jgi:multiple sugar transport system ATP-binding protein
MASITLTNIKKVYPGKDEVVAVQDFNLKIEDKEFIILVGPSGCGKSTMLRMIAGLEEITEGEVKIGDTVVNDIPPKDRDIAMVFQNYALYPHMTVYDNMAFGLKLRKMPKAQIKELVTRAADILEIGNVLNRRPKALSGGQRQRVALGRAIVRNPKVFLLDEPLSNLDAKLRTQMRTEISKLHKQLGTTFVYVTHDQTEAMTMGDRIVVMKDGYIQQVDTPSNLYQYPHNLFVAGFIGSPQMNFLNGVLKNEKTYYTVDLAGQKLIIPDAKNKNYALDSYIGKKVIVGIRCEDITEASTESVNTFKITIDITEMMGSEVLAYFDFAGSRMVGKFKPDTKAAAGREILVGFDASKVHLFDPETEKVITNQAGA